VPIDRPAHDSQVSQGHRVFKNSLSFIHNSGNIAERLKRDAKVPNIIIGEERGESTGYPHSQDDAEFRNNRSFWQIKKLRTIEAHWERAQGTAG
jgi:hypothetical protein